MRIDVKILGDGELRLRLPDEGLVFPGVARGSDGIDEIPAIFRQQRQVACFVGMNVEREIETRAAAARKRADFAELVHAQAVRLAAIVDGTKESSPGCNAG